MEPTAIICLQVKRLPLIDCQYKKLGGLVAKTVRRKPVDFTGCGDSISQKRQDIPGTNKQSAGLAERADSRLHQRGKGAKERRQRSRADQEFQHGGRSHMSTQFSTHGKERTAKAKSPSLSGFCLPSFPLCLVLVALHAPPIPQTTHTHTPTLLPSFYSAERRAGWKRRARRMKWRGKG